MITREELTNFWYEQLGLSSCCQSIDSLNRIEMIMAFEDLTGIAIMPEDIPREMDDSGWGITEMADWLMTKVQ